MKMKKMLSIVLCLAMVLTLAACGGSGAAAKMTMVFFWWARRDLNPHVRNEH